jgi:hypothetical protein
MSAAVPSSSSSAATFRYSCVKKSARLKHGRWSFEVQYNPNTNMRPKFDAKFADGGFASKQIAELHQEAAQRSVEKGGEDYLDPKGRKEAYKLDPKLVAALAALERAAEEAVVLAADREAEAGEVNEGNEGVAPPRIPRRLPQPPRPLVDFSPPTHLGSKRARDQRWVEARESKRNKLEASFVDSQKKGRRRQERRMRGTRVLIVAECEVWVAR